MQIYTMNMHQNGPLQAVVGQLKVDEHHVTLFDQSYSHISVHVL